MQSLEQLAMLRVAQVVPETDAEGPGRRFALWFQGCPLRCPGCCNPEYLPFDGGEERTLASVLAQLDAARVEGVTLLGGEPFAHAGGAAALAKSAQARGLSVMVFTGYTLETLRRRTDPGTQALLAHTDLLVDGPYLKDQPDTARRWIGSRNQRIHCLTTRHSPSDSCWRTSNTLEIRVEGDQITVNGFPAAHAVELWQGWTPKPRILK